MPIVKGAGSSVPREEEDEEFVGVDGDTLSELEAEAAAIAAADAQLAEEAEAAAKPTQPSFLQKAVGAISAPLAFVTGTTEADSFNPADWIKAGVENYQKSVAGEDTHTFGDELEQQVPGNDNPAAKWGKRIGGFVGDVALDPATYVTGGTAAVGRQTAKAAGVAALKNAAGKELAPEVAEAATKTLLSDTNLASAVEAIAKQSPEAVKVLPKVTQGGIRVGKEGPTLVPGSVTRKVSAPVGKLARTLTNPIVDKLTPLKMARHSPEGWKAAELFREAGGTTNALQHAGQEAARQLHRAFEGMPDEEVAAIVRGEIPAASKTQAAAVDAWKSFRDTTYDKARESSNLAYREDPIPRAFTKDYISRVHGDMAGDPGLDPFLDTLGAHGKERGLGEMTDQEAAEFLRQKHTLEPDFPVYENPLTAMSRYALEFPERMKTQRFKAGLEDEGLIKTKNALRDETLPAGARSMAMGDPETLARLGVEGGDDLTRAADEARDAYYDALNARGRGVPTGEQMAEEATLRRAMEAARQAAKESQPVGHIPQGWRGIGKSSYYAPDDIAEFVAKEMRPNVRPNAWTDATKAFKAGVTVPWPGFHVRNLYGSQASNLLRGGGLSGMRLKRALASTADDEIVPGLEKWGLTGAQVREMMGKEPVLGGRTSQLAEFAGEGRRGLLGRTAERVSPDLARRMGPLGESGGVTKALRYPEKIMNATEGLARSPAYLHALKKWGDPYAARMFAAAAHGDYTEWAPLERQIRDYGVPFYKWVRTNLPHQAQMLAERPGRTTIPFKATDAIEGDDRAAFEENNLLTEQQSEHNAFLNPFDPSKLVTMDLPTYDLNEWADPAKALVASSHPVWKTMAEIAFDKDAYFGSDINRFQATDGPWRGIAAALEKIPGGDAVVHRSQGGELRIDSRIKRLSNIMPTARIVSTLNTLSSDKPLTDQLASLLGGVRVEGPDPFEQYRREDILDDLSGEVGRRGFDEDEPSGSGNIVYRP